MPRASRKLPLDGWYVISTRPLGLHAGVRRSAAKCGAIVFALSPLQLQPIQARPALRQALRCSRIVVTSPAAARFAHAQIALESRPGQRWFALGAGSAAILRRCGIERVLVPDHGSNSESLLAHEQLREVRDQRIGLITAPGGRGLLVRELQARGATVVVAEVYRRQAHALPAARLRAFNALPLASALLITSDEAFSLLWQALDEAARAHLLCRPCVVSSERLAAQVLALGFSLVLRARDARPANLLAVLVDHVGEGGLR